VDDEVDGIVRLLVAGDSEDIHHPSISATPRADGRGNSRKIIELTSSRSRILYEALPEDDPKVRRPDISRAERLLGWSPRISLEEGLGNTIEYFRLRLAHSS